MKNKKCELCGSQMKRNGKTKSGSQRWRCTKCGTSITHTNDITTRQLKQFLDWLLSKDRQLDMPGCGRTFRRNMSKFWNIWPIPEFVDEVHRVIFVDGIYLSRKVVVLIARSEKYILSWHMARSETSSAYKELLSKIAPPDMVITDGGSGFAKAVKDVWPETKVQRCLFHVFCQVRRYTTSRPKLNAGVELYSIAKELLHIDNLHQAQLWVDKFVCWCETWNDFLEEKTYTERGLEFTHRRLVDARRSLMKLIRKNVLFTYLDPELTLEGKLPATNNIIEGGTNAQIRAILRNHRGMSLMHELKAVFWYCYMNTECPKKPSEILKYMPTDSDIDILRNRFAASVEPLDGPEEYGKGLVWEELHHKSDNFFN